MKKLTYLIILALLPVISFAADENDPYKAAVEFGYVGTSGNTDNTTLNLKYDGSYRVNKWTHNMLLSAYLATTSGETTGERYLAVYQPRYALSDRSYLFGFFRYSDDRFSGFKYQASQTVGYGRKFLIGPKHFFEGEAGAGARQQEESVEPYAYNGEPVIQLNGRYKYAIAKSTTFTQTLAIVGGESNTEVASLTGLKVMINKSLAVALGLDVKYNSEVPADKKNTDTKTTANIVYSF